MKITLRFFFTPARKVSQSKQETIYVCMDVGMKPLFFIPGTLNYYSHYVICKDASQSLKRKLLYNLTITFLGLYTEASTFYRRDTWTSILIAALFIIAQK